MKNDLTCGVVRDLLPSYVEGLLGEESQEAVDRHLEGCPGCMAQKEAMSAPAEQEKGAEKEVDYLKQVKKRNRGKILVSVFITAVVLLGALLLKVFVIGTPLQAQSVAVKAEVQEENVLHLSIVSVSSGDAFHGCQVETVNGVASVYARRVQVSPLYQDGTCSVDIPLKNVQEVWLGGTSGILVWQNGMVITQECRDLLALRTPYCGDAPALERIAEALQLRERLGNYTTEIQTSKEPYRWSLYFEDTLNTSQNNYMIRCEYLILALVDNLSKVRIYPPAKEGEEPMWSQEMPLDAANQAISITGATSINGEEWINLTELYNRAHGTSWQAKTSVKDYTRTPADFQQLIAVLDYHFLELRGAENPAE